MSQLDNISSTEETTADCECFGCKVMMPSFHLHRQRYNPTFLSSGGASKAGDVGYVPAAMSHYLENTGTVPFRFLETFNSRYFVDFSLDTWMALTPPELVETHLKLDRQVMDALRKTKVPVVPIAAVEESASRSSGSVPKVLQALDDLAGFSGRQRPSRYLPSLLVRDAAKPS